MNLNLVDVKWEPETYYVVRVSFFKTNPEHLSLLYSGFLSSGVPSGYAAIFNPSYESVPHPKDAYSIEIVAKLGTIDDIATPMDRIESAMKTLVKDLKGK